MKKNVIISLVLNAIIFLLTVFSTFSALFDYRFMTSGSSITFNPNFSIFKYFTTDSNIILGIISAVVMAFEIAALAKKKYELPKSLYVLKLLATTGVTLTMITTIVYLAPKDPLGYFNKFLDSNFFFHLIIPILALISFVCFEKTNTLSKKTTLIAILPMVAYIIFYACNTLMHLENNSVAPGYDFYGFFDAGLLFAILLIPLMIVITYLISVVLWFVNKKDL